MSERQVWFITRPERDPAFHPEALEALKVATNNFTTKWARNRVAHKMYEQVLSDMEIKRKNISNDGSGGRTWAAMLRTFAYCYIDDEGYIRPTKSGEKILKGEKVYENTKKQILTLQYPNAYFLEAGFRPKFSDSFRIRPALFLIKLANQECLDFYITKEEITFFAMTAQKDSEINDVTESIITFRESNPLERNAMKQRIATEHDHRERSDNGARDYNGAHSDVAHTFMMICAFTGLAEYIRGDALRIEPIKTTTVTSEIAEFEKRYPFNTRYMISLQRMAENNGLDVDSYKASRYGDIKPATNLNKMKRKVEKIIQQYPDPQSIDPDVLINELSLLIPKNVAEKIVADLQEDPNLSQLDPTFVESYLNVETDRLFEDKTGEIFRGLGFTVLMRPKSLNGDRTEIEIMLKYGHNEFAIIDAKNYGDTFPLAANLVSHMASEYIPNYHGYEGRELKFYGYVAVNDFSGERNLAKITERAERIINGGKIEGIMLNAKTLLGFLDYCIENNIPVEQRVSMFVNTVKNKGYKTFESFLKETN